MPKDASSELEQFIARIAALQATTEHERVSYMMIDQFSFQFEQFLKTWDDLSLLENLKTCCISYINLIRAYSESQPDPNTTFHKHAIFKFMGVLNTLNSIQCLHNNLFKEITPSVMEILCDPSLEEVCGMELMRFLNNVSRNTERAVRHQICEQSNFFQISKLADILSASGCYEYQMLILECIFLLCSAETVVKLSDVMFPGAPSLQRAINTFNVKQFDKSSRTFLNMLNSIYGNITSVIANKVFLDDVPISGPVDINHQCHPLWVDFNTDSLAIFCDRDSLIMSLSSQDSESVGWELITIFYKDIEKIEKPLENCRDRTFTFFLTEKLHTMFISSTHISSSRILSLIFTERAVINKMEKEILPKTSRKTGEILRGISKDNTQNSTASSSNFLLSSTEDGAIFKSKIPDDIQSVSSTRRQSEKSLMDMFQCIHSDDEHHEEMYTARTEAVLDSIVDDGLQSSTINLSSQVNRSIETLQKSPKTALQNPSIQKTQKKKIIQPPSRMLTSILEQDESNSRETSVRSIKENKENIDIEKKVVNDKVGYYKLSNTMNENTKQEILVDSANRILRSISQQRKKMGSNSEFGALNVRHIEPEIPTEPSRQQQEQLMIAKSYSYDLQISSSQNNSEIEKGDQVNAESSSDTTYTENTNETKFLKALPVNICIEVSDDEQSDDQVCNTMYRSVAIEVDESEWIETNNNENHLKVLQSVVHRKEPLTLLCQNVKSPQILNKETTKIKGREIQISKKQTVRRGKKIKSNKKILRSTTKNNKYPKKKNSLNSEVITKNQYENVSENASSTLNQNKIDNVATIEAEEAVERSNYQIELSKIPKEHVEDNFEMKEVIELNAEQVHERFLSAQSNQKTKTKTLSSIKKLENIEMDQEGNSNINEVVVNEYILEKQNAVEPVLKSSEVGENIKDKGKEIVENDFSQKLTSNIIHQNQQLNEHSNKSKVNEIIENKESAKGEDIEKKESDVKLEEMKIDSVVDKEKLNLLPEVVQKALDPSEREQLKKKKLKRPKKKPGKNKDNKLLFKGAQSPEILDSFHEMESSQVDDFDLLKNTISRYQRFKKAFPGKEKEVELLQIMEEVDKDILNATPPVLGSFMETAKRGIQEGNSNINEVVVNEYILEKQNAVEPVLKSSEVGENIKDKGKEIVENDFSQKLTSNIIHQNQQLNEHSNKSKVNEINENKESAKEEDNEKKESDVKLEEVKIDTVVDKEKLNLLPEVVQKAFDPSERDQLKKKKLKRPKKKPGKYKDNKLLSKDVQSPEIFDSFHEMESSQVDAFDLLKKNTISPSQRFKKALPEKEKEVELLQIMEEVDEDIINATPPVLDLFMETAKNIVKNDEAPLEEQQELADENVTSQLSGPSTVVLDQGNLRSPKEISDYQIYLSDIEPDSPPEPKRKTSKKKPQPEIHEDEIRKYFDPKYSMTLSYLQFAMQQPENETKQSEKPKMATSPVRRQISMLRKPKRKLYHPHMGSVVDLSKKGINNKTRKGFSDDSSDGLPEEITVEALVHDIPLQYRQPKEITGIEKEGTDAKEMTGKEFVPPTSQEPIEKESLKKSHKADDDAIQTVTTQEDPLNRDQEESSQELPKKELSAVSGEAIRLTQKQEIVQKRGQRQKTEVKIPKKGRRKAVDNDAIEVMTTQVKAKDHSQEKILQNIRRRGRPKAIDNNLTQLMAAEENLVTTDLIETEKELTVEPPKKARVLNNSTIEVAAAQDIIKKQSVEETSQKMPPKRKYTKRLNVTTEITRRKKNQDKERLKKLFELSNIHESFSSVHELSSFADTQMRVYMERNKKTGTENIFASALDETTGDVIMRGGDRSNNEIISTPVKACNRFNLLKNRTGTPSYVNMRKRKLTEADIFDADEDRAVMKSPKVRILQNITLQPPDCHFPTDDFDEETEDLESRSKR